MSDTDIGYELYKLEYEAGARRYEDLYKATWTNFSYLTVVAGGIFAFGSKYLSEGATAIAAVMPILFWWLAVFEPMNKYGDQVVDRLSEIEGILNARFHSQLMTPASPPLDLNIIGLQHYTRFKGKKSKSKFPDWVRVRFFVRLFVPIFIAVGGIYGVYTLVNSKRAEAGGGVKFDPAEKVLEVKVGGAGAGDVQKLSQQVDDLRKELEAVKGSLGGIAQGVEELKRRPGGPQNANAGGPAGNQNR